MIEGLLWKDDGKLHAEAWPLGGYTAVAVSVRTGYVTRHTGACTCG